MAGLGVLLASGLLAAKLLVGKAEVEVGLGQVGVQCQSTLIAFDGFLEAGGLAIGNSQEVIDFGFLDT